MTVCVPFPKIRLGSIRLALLILVMLYGAVAGLRTVADFDLGWQMADARNPLSSHDMLSYTMPGAQWVYPPLAGILFRQLFHIDGYAAISWFCALALIATLAIVALRSGIATLLILLVSVPALADQMIPRSGLFTVLIAAAYSQLLLSHYWAKQSKRLWLLPVLMVFWVNLHTGFIAGFGLMLAYIAAELVDCLRISERVQALRKLKQASPWIAAAMICTLGNPWGFRMYEVIAAQEKISELQSTVILELAPLYREFSWTDFHPFAPLNAIWLVLAISVIALVLLFRQRRLGLALFLTLAILICLSSARTQGVFLPIACLVAGHTLEVEAQLLRQCAAPSVRSMICQVVAAGALVFVVWRCVDVVTDRTFIQQEQIVLYGAGASWWLPQKAAAFVEQEHLPTELFSTFNLSSYLTWRLGPHYRDFADGRYLPFGDRIVAEQLRLTSLPLDSDAWKQAAARYHIQTVILPLSRFFGIESIPLRDDCESHEWAPVYFDATSIVFVRNDALGQTQLASFRVQCQQQQLIVGGEVSADRRSRIEHFQMLANAAVIYYLLGRSDDAEKALESALRISRDDDSLLLLSGQLEVSRGDFSGAEQSFRSILQMQVSNDAAWYQLGLLCANQRRYGEAIDAFRHALQYSAQPNFAFEWSLAKVEVLGGEDDAGLQTLRDALDLLADSGPAESAARGDIYDVEAAVYSKQLNWRAAIEAEKEAVEQTPTVARRWQTLATLYANTGEQEKAQQAEQRANTLLTHNR
jgi:tetratricopeptide (TPR) repeat protein